MRYGVKTLNICFIFKKKFRYRYRNQYPFGIGKISSIGTTLFRGLEVIMYRT